MVHAFFYAIICAYNDNVGMLPMHGAAYIVIALTHAFRWDDKHRPTFQAFVCYVVTVHDIISLISIPWVRYGNDP